MSRRRPSPRVHPLFDADSDACNPAAESGTPAHVPAKPTADPVLLAWHRARVELARVQRDWRRRQRCREWGFIALCMYLALCAQSLIHALLG